MTIPAAPEKLLRGHVADTLEELRKGIWDPHFVHRRDRAKKGIWGRWTHDPELEYGLSDVKAFWFSGEKATPEQGESESEYELHEELF